MSNLIYLLMAVLISIIGCVVIWWRSRPPRSMSAQIEEFAKELESLAPDRRLSARRPRRRR